MGNFLGASRSDEGIDTIKAAQSLLQITADPCYKGVSIDSQQEKENKTTYLSICGGDAGVDVHKAPQLLQQVLQIPFSTINNAKVSQKRAKQATWVPGGVM